MYSVLWTSALLLSSILGKNLHIDHQEKKTLVSSRFAKWHILGVHNSRGFFACMEQVPNPRVKVSAKDSPNELIKLNQG